MQVGETKKAATRHLHINKYGNYEYSTVCLMQLDAAPTRRQLAAALVDASTAGRR
ncbi:uncharacterized protein TrAtP1_001916 [Trichoderma atroviride]|uniref:uncharacterized protein n=1 Tax=Hypocrea atroviridis TaxID=63577 RepID=UPI003329A39E|nr:hypothetical protein TrAtP1_001916 [Trichoderma atroviride]